MKNKLEIDSVILDFGSKRILQNVYLQSETGKITGLLGRNGCGKSCLLNILFGELNPLDKSIRLNGVHMEQKSRSSKVIKYLPQFNFTPSSTTLKRIFKDFKLNFKDFITLFPEFEKYYKSKLNILSSGEKRIVEIYSIVASPAKFCLLDEPFSQIMPVHVNAIKELIVRERKNKGIVITDHLYKHVMEISDDIYLIVDGTTKPIRSLDDLISLGYTKKK